MRRRALALSCVLLVLLTGCVLRAAAEESGPPEGAYKVYFAAEGEQDGGAAVGYEYRVPAEGELPWRSLLNLLLEGPEGEGLRSPFPQGVTCLTDLSDGRLHVDFSEQYGELSGIELTIANYCVALTLCQVAGVEGVYLTAQGEDLPAQSMPESRLLTAEDVALSGDEGKPVNIDVTLWYPRADGQGLTERYRRLVLTEDDSLPESLLHALTDTQGDETIVPAVPMDAAIRSVSTEGEICYVDLSASFPERLRQNRTLARQMVRALVNTLCSNVESVTGVQLQVEGETVSLLGGVPAASPIGPSFDTPVTRYP